MVYKMGWQKAEKLVIKKLHIEFEMDNDTIHAVKGVSLEIPTGRITALVGESGSGKSVTSLAVMDLLPENGRIREGEIWLKDKPLHLMGKKERRQVNGRGVGMIFQDPGASLDPLYTVGSQITEGIRMKKQVSRKEAYRQGIFYLNAVNLPEPSRLMKMYPFELSGGMCQRVMIAMTIALSPDFLIADEPTTALDVTVQKQILSELYRLSRDENMGILLITHDLGVVAEIADYVYIMRQGQIVEEADAAALFHHPEQPYTRMLLDGIF